MGYEAGLARFGAEQSDLGPAYGFGGAVIALALCLVGIAVFEILDRRRR